MTGKPLDLHNQCPNLVALWPLGAEGRRVRLRSQLSNADRRVWFLSSGLRVVTQRTNLRSAIMMPTQSLPNGFSFVADWRQG